MDIRGDDRQHEYQIGDRNLSQELEESKGFNYYSREKGATKMIPSHINRK